MPPSTPAKLSDWICGDDRVHGLTSIPTVKHKGRTASRTHDIVERLALGVVQEVEHGRVWISSVPEVN